MCQLALNFATNVLLLKRSYLTVLRIICEAQLGINNLRNAIILNTVLLHKHTHNTRIMYYTIIIIIIKYRFSQLEQFMTTTLLDGVQTRLRVLSYKKLLGPGAQTYLITRYRCREITLPVQTVRRLEKLVLSDCITWLYIDSTPVVMK